MVKVVSPRRKIGHRSRERENSALSDEYVESLSQRRKGRAESSPPEQSIVTVEKCSREWQSEYLDLSDDNLPMNSLGKRSRLYSLKKKRFKTHTSHSSQFRDEEEEEDRIPTSESVRIVICRNAI